MDFDDEEEVAPPAAMTVVMDPTSSSTIKNKNIVTPMKDAAAAMKDENPAEDFSDNPHRYLPRRLHHCPPIVLGEEALEDTVKTTGPEDASSNNVVVDETEEKVAAILPSQVANGDCNRNFPLFNKKMSASIFSLTPDHKDRRTAVSNESNKTTIPNHDEKCVHDPDFNGKIWQEPSEDVLERLSSTDTSTVSPATINGTADAFSPENMRSLLVEPLPVEEVHYYIPQHTSMRGNYSRGNITGRVTPDHVSMSTFLNGVMSHYFAHSQVPPVGAATIGGRFSPSPVNLGELPSGNNGGNLSFTTGIERGRLWVGFPLQPQDMRNGQNTATGPEVVVPSNETNSTSAPVNDVREASEGNESSNTKTQDSRNDDGREHESTAQSVRPPNGRRHDIRFLPTQVEVWTLRLKEAIQFKKEHGHCRIPTNYPPNQALATWAKRQRNQYYNLKKLLGSSKRRRFEDAFQENRPSQLNRTARDARSTGHTISLTAERILELEKIGLCWSMRSSSWTIQFEQLKAFIDSNGNTTFVPRNYLVAPKLANWVKVQRHQYKLWIRKKPSTLTRERVNMLHSIGFDFRPNPDRNTGRRNWI